MTDDLLVKIKVNDILASEENNCRGKISPLDVIDLWKSIEKDGLIQPIVVKKLDKPINGKFYRLICGYRRHMAHIVGKQELILSRIIDCSDAEAEILNLAENLQRKELNLWQEAVAVGKLHAKHWTQERIAAQLKVSQGWVICRLKLLSLPQEIQKEAAEGVLKPGHVVIIYDLKFPEKQFAAVRKIKEANERGEKVTQKVLQEEMTPKAKLITKKTRTREEIFTMIEKVMEKAGAGLHTRCMAWCAGEISDEELLKEI